MSHFLEQPKLFDQSIRLSPEERRDPAGVLERFFEDYRLHECRHLLWEMVECCLTSEHESFSNAEERAGLLQQYKDLERLLEAAWLIAQQKRKKAG